MVTGTGTIQGKVLDSAGNPPTRQFIVELEPKGGSRPGTWGSSGQIKQDGTFEIKGIPPGEYLLVAKPNPMREGVDGLGARFISFGDGCEERLLLHIQRQLELGNSR